MPNSDPHGTGAQGAESIIELGHHARYDDAGLAVAGVSVWAQYGQYGIRPLQVHHHARLFEAVQQGQLVAARQADG
jgi:hypothetical protein